MSNDYSSDTDTSTSDTTCNDEDTSCDSSEDTSELPEDGNLSDDGSDELSEGDEGGIDAGDASESELNVGSDKEIDVTDENSDTSSDGAGDMSNDNADTSGDNIEITEETNELPEDGDLSDDGSDELSEDDNRFAQEINETYDSAVFDEVGNLRVMNNEEYAKLSPEQQMLFEEMFNQLSEEGQENYNTEFAKADFDNYNKHVEEGSWTKDKDNERDLNDIIDGKYNGNEDEIDGLITEHGARVVVSAVSTSYGLDPLTKSQITNQAGDIGRIYGPDIMKTMAQTAYIQEGINIPTPIVHVDQYGNKTYDYGQKFSDITSETTDINTLKNNYCADLLNRSEYPETIDKIIINAEWGKITPEQNELMREQFVESKNDLINKWEEKNNCDWPTYKDNIYSQNGKLIRHTGDKYDAHHIQPLTFGGKNSSNNLTPLHVLEHYDKQGIHATNSPYGQIEKYYKEIKNEN